MPSLKVFVLLLLVTSRMAGAATSAAPKVVFLGDETTSHWTGLFASNPNFINKGVPGEWSYQMAARFQSDVVSLHPAAVHILAGYHDVSAADDATMPILIAEFEASMVSMISEARAANIRVILGTIPPLLISNTVETPQLWQVYQPVFTLEANSWIESYGLAHNIPVMNYHDVLCGCVGSNAPGSIGYYPLMSSNGVLPAPAGYAAMSSLAETAVATINLALKSGYLRTANGVNKLILSDKLSAGLTKFTPVGVYSDGVARPILNTNFAGSNGTWTSSDSSVVSVGYDGTAYGLAPGKATVSYVSPNGIHFSPWVLTVISEN